jgi:hypothetical protein
MMNRFSLIIAAFLVLIVLILLRSFGTSRFRYDANRWAAPSYSGGNIITADLLPSLEGELLFVTISSDGSYSDAPGRQSIDIPVDSLLTQKYRRILSRHKGPLILSNNDISVAARIWMLLSQSGYSNLYILSPDGSDEHLKEKIRTDSIANPDL